VEPVEADPLAVDAAQRVRAHFAAERIGQTRTGVIDEHDQDVRHVLRQPALHLPVRIAGLLHRPPGATGRRRGRERQAVLMGHRLHDLTSDNKASADPGRAQPAGHHPDRMK
jgi:hypothetical protein